MTVSRAPGTPHARIRVYDGVPGTRGEWVRTAGHGCTPADLVDGLRRVHALLA